MRRFQRPSHSILTARLTARQFGHGLLVRDDATGAPALLPGLVLGDRRIHLGQLDRSRGRVVPQCAQDPALAERDGDRGLATEVDDLIVCTRGRSTALTSTDG